MSTIAEQHGRVRTREKRVPIGTGAALRFDERPGYYRRVVTDDNGRVERFSLAGYEPVRDPSVDQAADKAGKASYMGDIVRRPIGGGKYGVLMEIPIEWYNEDQEKKAQLIDAKEDQLQRSNPNDGQYGNVTIKR